MDVNLLLDDEAFLQAIKKFETHSKELNDLRKDIVNSFEQLRKDWDSDAGRQFFVNFEENLLNNLDQYSKVFKYISQNLTTASTKYGEVFSVADALVNEEY